MPIQNAYTYFFKVRYVLPFLVSLSSPTYMNFPLPRITRISSGFKCMLLFSMHWPLTYIFLEENNSPELLLDSFVEKLRLYVCPQAQALKLVLHVCRRNNAYECGVRCQGGHIYNQKCVKYRIRRHRFPL